MQNKETRENSPKTNFSRHAQSVVKYCENYKSPLLRVKHVAFQSICAEFAHNTQNLLISNQLYARRGTAPPPFKIFGTKFSNNTRGIYKLLKQPGWPIYRLSKLRQNYSCRYCLDSRGPP